jgi:hypothetical protein
VRHTARSAPLDAVFGSAADEIVSASPVPVAVAALTETRPARVILTLDPDAATTSPAAAAAGRFARELAAGDLPLEIRPDGGAQDGDTSLLRDVRPGDIVVVPAPSQGGAFPGRAARLLETAGVSVVAVSGAPGSSGSASDESVGLQVVGRRA